MRALLILFAACGGSQPTTTTTTTTTGPTTLTPAAWVPHGPKRVDREIGTTESVEEGMLRLVNEYRRVAGVPPVPLDPTLTNGCREHTAYMVQNRDKPQLHSINAHHQDPSLPLATPAGAECGKHAVLYPNVPDLRAAVHGWMGSILHRRPVISPQIIRVGIGASPLPVPGRYAVALQFVYGPADPAKFPILYPVDGQTDVPLEFINEEPNVIPPGGSATPGHPFTLNFPPYDPVTGVTATIVDDTGAALPVYISSPEKPASKYSDQPGVVGVIPEQRLRAATKYTATVTATWNGKTQTYRSTYTTMARTDVGATDEAALLAIIGRPARVRGKIKHASQWTQGVMYLKIEGPASIERILSIDAVVPSALIAKQLNWKSPDYKGGLDGLVVEIEATPSLMFKTFRLDPASAFRVVR